MEQTAAQIRKDLNELGGGLLLDGSNAYGSLYRREILRELYSTDALRSLYGVCSWLLEPPGFVGWYRRDGSLAGSSQSTRGIRQGMLLGPLLFAVGIHRRMVELQEKHPRVKFVLYLDDVNILGPEKDAYAALPDTIAAFNGLGIRINESKSTSFFPQVSACPMSQGSVPLFDETQTPDETEQPAKIPRAQGVMRVLGAGFAADEDADVSEWLLENITKHQHFFQALRNPAFPKAVSIRLLMASGIPRANFVARCQTPAESFAALQWFDTQVEETLAFLLGKPGVQVDGRTLEIARLPMRMGGLGLRPWVETATFASLCVGEKGGQKAAQALADTARREALWATLSPREKAWLNASSVATRPLTSGSVLLPNIPFVTWLRCRLLIRVLPEGAVCICGADATNSHVFTCGRLHSNPRIFRHNSVLDELAASVVAATASTVRLEPASGGANRARPDLVATQPCAAFVTDVTIATPGSLGVGDERAWAAATHAAKGKRDKWQRWAETHALRFAPFVLEATGALAPESLAWLREVVRDSAVDARGTANHIAARCIFALLRSQVALFVAACGSLHTLE